MIRVVSLVPSVTETLLAWNVEPIAVTRFCEQPGLTTVGGTKDPDVDAIAALRPDLVVLDEEENRLEDHDALVAAGVPVHVLRIRGIADLDDQLPPLAERVGGHWLPLDLPDPPEPWTTAFVPIWRRPWMALGTPTYGTSMLAALGVRNVFADEPYPPCTLDDAAARRPDLVLAPDEPYPFGERHRYELQTVAPTVELLDGKDLLWWGVRTASALSRLTIAIGGGPDTST
ncbi:MAG TPA: helical backbone metal receptor [Acidimicrobiales bacterium]